MWCMILYDTESVMLNMLYKVDNRMIWYDVYKFRCDIKLKHDIGNMIHQSASITSNYVSW